MKKKRSIFLLALILYFPATAINHLHAYEGISINITKPAETGNPGIYSSSVSISIPEGTYIYANPKGPGIGKPTTLSLKLPPDIILSGLFYPAGDKYTPEGAGDHVFIWKKSVIIPFYLSAGKQLKPGKHRIGLNINLLQCNAVSCIPFDKNYELVLNIERPIPSDFSGSSLYVPGTETSFQGEWDKSSQSGTITENEKNIIDMLDISPLYAGKKVTGILQAILFGIIAGLILNLMPCVLPVVSLKVMALVHSRGEEKNTARRHSILFSSGIITSFIILAGLVAFSGYRWGGLFQEKPFLIGMAVFIFAMALSLFGVFTINVPGFAGRAASRKGPGGLADSFVKGMLATLLATPCSGPFLGGILAWTFTQPAYVIFLVFSSLGLGMALPYIIVAARPQLAMFIPKPGPWTVILEEVMGFILLFTVVYLISLLDRDSAASTMLLIVFVSIGVWQFGRFGSVDKSYRARFISLCMLMLIILGGTLISFFLFIPGSDPVHSRPFSINELLKNRDSGKITVVNFTAEWCPNCRLVEKTALDSASVKKYISEEDIVYMTADITRKNTTAEYFMSKLGSGSIPFLAVFPAGKKFSTPVCLRDLYSADDVVYAIMLARKKE